MRADEFIREEEKLDEILPLVGLAAKGVGGVLAKGAMKLGGALAKGAVKGAAGAIGRGLGQAAKGAVGMVAKPFQSGTGDTIGTPNNQNATPTDPAKKAALDRIKDQSIKPGAELDLPTVGPGGTEKFKVSRVTGDEVEIENPNPALGEPYKTVYKKQDLKKSITL